jgi:L-ascorbate metabolism protein UlaG (beta-lactamase superfamily)
MPDSFASPDVAIITNGAYDQPWFNSAQHDDKEEAVQIMRDVDARAAVGIHWGTFKLTDEPREEPAMRLTARLAAADITPNAFMAMQAADAAEFG